MEKGHLLYNDSQTARVINPTTLEKLSSSTISETLKQQLQEQINSAKQWNANLKKGRDSKLIDRYIEIYGPLTSKSRNYVILQGSFRDPNDNVADIPLIKYVFKH